MHLKSLFILSIIGATYFSHPTSPHLVSGQAELFQENNRLTIQTQSDKTILNWDSFSINPNETTHFLQPHELAATLNRVISDSPSQILGTLSSNGVLFLINPNGILVGKEGMIDVNGLLASTLDLSDSAFLQGDELLFQGHSQEAIENLGCIQGKKEGVFLIGQYIINEGDILALSSSVKCGAGSRILLKTKEKKIYIHPNLEEVPAKTGESNPYSLAIRNCGTIQALSTETRGGEIYLVADQGTVHVEKSSRLTADHEISLLGSVVEVKDQSELSTQTSGTIQIGGSFGGRNPLVPNAQETFIDKGVKICANSSPFGDGGSVSVFATDRAAFHGSIEARGGELGGDGGIVEVSGLQGLSFKGQVDTQAPCGNDGLLIIDPTDIIIGLPTAGGTFSGGNPDTFSLAFLGAAATLSVNDLNNALQTNNVLVTTASIHGGAGNITVSAATSLSLLTTSHTLNFQADNNININSPFSMIDLAGGTSVLTMNAANDITLTNSVTGVNLTSINLNAGNDLYLDNAISANGITVNLTALNDIVSQGGGTNTITANQCNLNATNDITIANDINFNGGGAASTLTMIAGVDFTQTQAMRFSNWGTVNASTTAGNFLVDNAVTATNTSSITFNGGVDLINQGVTNTFNDVTGNFTDLFLNANRDVRIDSQIDINNFNSCTIQPARDFINLNDFEPDNTTTVTVMAGQDIFNVGLFSDIIASNGTTLSFIAARDYISVRPFTTTNVNNVNITATTGDVIISGFANNVPGATATVTAGNNIVLTTIFQSLTSGDITFTATNDIDIGPSTALSQVGTASGTIRINAGNDLRVIGGGTTNDRSQIGFSGTSVNTDIELTVGGNINVTAGGSTNSIAHIGHGFVTAGTIAGDIIIHSVGGDVTIQGDTGIVGATKFAQIGHTRFAGSAVSNISGNIRGSTLGSPALINGNLTLLGGADATCFALFGHGGRNSNAIDTYSGNISVQANAIQLSGGTNPDCFANIGFFAVSQDGGTNPVIINSPASVEVISNTTLTMTGNTNGDVSIGGRVLNTAAHPCTINLDSVRVQTGGDLIMTSGSTGAETDATIGALCDFGTAETALTLSVGGDLLMTAGTGAPCQIINGTGTVAAKNTSIQVTGNITPTVLGPTFEAFIENATGNLDVVAQGVITLPDLTRITNQGANNGTLNVTGGTIFVLDGGTIANIGIGTSSITTTTDSLSISNTSTITSIGNLTASIARDLSVFDNALMASTGGSVNVSAGRDISLIGTAGGAATLSSSGNGQYLAGRDIILRGVSAASEGGITNTTGFLQVIAGENIEVNPFGKIENQGPGSLTLVVDNQAPIAPAIGNGEFNLSAMGTVGRVGGGPLRIFAARQGQNSILGTGNLNGSTFTPGPLFVDTATEQWDTYFPSSFGGSPFTVFYKDGPIVPSSSVTPFIPNIFDILAFNPNALVPFFELSFLLEGPRQDLVIAWLYRFKVENNWCKEESGMCIPDFLKVQKLPPYIKRTSLIRL